MRQALASDEITIIRAVHYHQYDTYFFFDDPGQGRLRYREDEFLDEQSKVVGARARLTLTGPSREAAFGSVLLFRSRFFAPATHSPRFYREDFKPAREREVEKDRHRWLVAFRGVQFYVHVDHMMSPHAGAYFLEVKSRTWSRRDAQDKAAIIAELLELLGARPDETIDSNWSRAPGNVPRCVVVLRSVRATCHGLGPGLLGRGRRLAADDQPSGSGSVGTLGAGTRTARSRAGFARAGPGRPWRRACARPSRPAGGRQPAAHHDMAALRHHLMDAPGLRVEPVRHQRLAPARR